MRTTDRLAFAFWPLWTLALMLQLADAGSVALALLVPASGPLREANPLLLALAAHTSLRVLLLVKLVVAAVWLGVMCALWALCERHGASSARRGMALAVALVMAVIAGWSAWVFWHNLAIVMLAH